VMRTVKSCGPDAAVLASSSREASFSGATVAIKPFTGEQLYFRRPVYGRPQGWRCAPPPPAADGLDPFRPPVFRLGMRSAEAERDRSLCDG